MDSEGISNRKLLKGMSKIKLEDKCLLVIRKGTELAKRTTIKQLMETVKAIGVKDVGILIAESTADIGKIPEHKLNAAGFYHIGTVAKKLLDMKKGEEDQIEEGNDG